MKTDSWSSKVTLEQVRLAFLKLQEDRSLSQHKKKAERVCSGMGQQGEVVSLPLVLLYDWWYYFSYKSLSCLSSESVISLDL